MIEKRNINSNDFVKGTIFGDIQYINYISIVLGLFTYFIIKRRFNWVINILDISEILLGVILLLITLYRLIKKQSILAKGIFSFTFSLFNSFLFYLCGFTLLKGFTNNIIGLIIYIVIYLLIFALKYSLDNTSTIEKAFFSFINLGDGNKKKNTKKILIMFMFVFIFFTLNYCFTQYTCIIYAFYTFILSILLMLFSQSALYMYIKRYKGKWD